MEPEEDKAVHDADLLFSTKSRESGSCFVCFVCQAEFKKQYLMRRHIATHTQEKQHFCSVCGDSFVYRSTLSRHMAVHSNKRPYQCTFCPKAFKRSSVLQLHMMTHQKEKTFCCSQCDRGFRQKIHLINHMRTHTDEKPFSCTKCSAQFRTQANLRAHNLKHHSVAPAHNCTRCSKVFKRKTELRTHLYQAHPCVSCEFNGQSLLQKPGDNIDQTPVQGDSETPCTEPEKTEVACQTSTSSEQLIDYSALQLHVPSSTNEDTGYMDITISSDKNANSKADEFSGANESEANPDKVHDTVFKADEIPKANVRITSQSNQGLKFTIPNDDELNMNAAQIINTAQSAIGVLKSLHTPSPGFCKAKSNAQKKRLPFPGINSMTMLTPKDYLPQKSSRTAAQCNAQCMDTTWINMRFSPSQKLVSTVPRSHCLSSSAPAASSSARSPPISMPQFSNCSLPMNNSMLLLLSNTADNLPKL